MTIAYNYILLSFISLSIRYIIILYIFLIMICLFGEKYFYICINQIRK